MSAVVAWADAEPTAGTGAATAAVAAVASDVAPADGAAASAPCLAAAAKAFVASASAVTCLARANFCRCRSAFSRRRRARCRSHLADAAPSTPATSHSATPTPAASSGSSTTSSGASSSSSSSSRSPAPASSTPSSCSSSSSSSSSLPCQRATPRVRACQRPCRVWRPTPPRPRSTAPLLRPPPPAPALAPSCLPLFSRTLSFPSWCRWPCTCRLKSEKPGRGPRLTLIAPAAACPTSQRRTPPRRRSRGAERPSPPLQRSAALQHLQHLPPHPPLGRTYVRTYDVEPPSPSVTSRARPACEAQRAPLGRRRRARRSGRAARRLPACSCAPAHDARA